MGLPNLNMKEETKWILVLVVKRHHCANGLLKLWCWVFKCTRSEAVHILLYSSCYFPLLVLCIPWRETESALPKHVVFQGNAFWCILSDHFYKLLAFISSFYGSDIWNSYYSLLFSSSTFPGILWINLIYSAVAALQRSGIESWQDWIVSGFLFTTAQVLRIFFTFFSCYFIN